MLFFRPDKNRIASKIITLGESIIKLSISLFDPSNWQTRPIGPAHSECIKACVANSVCYLKLDSCENRPKILGIKSTAEQIYQCQNDNGVMP